MRRKYAVWVGGKPVEISTAAPDEAVREHWLLVNAGSDAELDSALDGLNRPEVFGLMLFSANGYDAWQAFCARHKLVVAAGGAVEDERGRLLVIHRRGHWDLPKGKLDAGETSAVAAVREVQEECGLRRLLIVEELPCTWHTYTEKGRLWLKRTDWFRMQASSKEQLMAQHEEDIDEVRWATRDELPEIIAGSYPSLRIVFDAWLAAP
ncbi:MAG TPA: NUDIX domain-containing protein [Flavobacteriales bacterium]|nr:NUDIX domain-containing protein [Flavobacteriales bacterium]